MDFDWTAVAAVSAVVISTISLFIAFRLERHKADLQLAVNTETDKYRARIDKQFAASATRQAELRDRLSRLVIASGALQSVKDAVFRIQAAAGAEALPSRDALALCEAAQTRIEVAYQEVHAALPEDERTVFHQAKHRALDLLGVVARMLQKHAHVPALSQEDADEIRRLVDALNEAQGSIRDAVQRNHLDLTNEAGGHALLTLGR